MESKEKLIVLENPYLRHLAILDHLRECLILDKEIKRQKNKEIEGKSQTLKNLEFHFENELTDLYILLKSECKEEVVERRLEKFRENALKDV